MLMLTTKNIKLAVTLIPMTSYHFHVTFLSVSLCSLCYSELYKLSDTTIKQKLYFFKVQHLINNLGNIFLNSQQHSVASAHQLRSVS